MNDDASSTLDERGRPCPMPVIALARAMADQTRGATIELLSDDPAARYDIPAWCRMTGHEFVAVSTVDGADPPCWRFTVRHH